MARSDIRKRTHCALPCNIVVLPVSLYRLKDRFLLLYYVPYVAVNEG